MIMLNYNDYWQRLKGCFVGKAIGGTLGMSREGSLIPQEVSYYDPVPEGMIANDDLDLQVVWLEVIRRNGLPVNRKDLADGFKHHLRAFPDEYGVATNNLEYGLMPPLSGYYNNKFYAGMGAAIRTEIWAALAPGDPDLAVRLAREDACIDHFDDGLEASTFLAAIQSAAYTEQKAERLIETGMSYLKTGGRLHCAFTDTLAWWQEDKDPLQVREKILHKYFRQNWTDVAINLSFILLSWLAGDGDFSKSICLASKLGYDADCTAATLGAILGIINPNGFEERWTRPLGDELVLSSCISNMHEVPTITALCQQIAGLCCQVLKYYGSNSQFDVEPKFPIDWSEPWARDNRLFGLKENHQKTESLVSTRPLTIRLLYPQQVALSPGETATFTALISNPSGKNTQGTLSLRVPDGWLVSPGHFPLNLETGLEQTISFEVSAPKDVRRRIPRNLLDFHYVTDTLSGCLSAGLLQTVDFLLVPSKHFGDICPPDSLFEHASVIHAHAHFLPLPEGAQLLRSEFRPPAYCPEVIMVVQGTRPIKVWLDQKLVLEHDGCEYVPAYHRSDNIAVMPLSGEWHNLVIQTGEHERKEGDDKQYKSPRAARVPVPGNPTMLELRQRYDAENLYQGEPAELFFGFASASGARWLNELEWRIPQKKT